MTMAAQNCTACEIGFYVKAGGCVACTVIDGCLTYSNPCAAGTETQDQTCTACSSTEYINIASKDCTTCTTITGCATYNNSCNGSTTVDQVNCTACNSNYTANGTFNCVPTVSNLIIDPYSGTMMCNGSSNTASDGGNFQALVVYKSGDSADVTTSSTWSIYTSDTCIIGANTGVVSGCTLGNACGSATLTAYYVAPLDDMYTAEFAYAFGTP